MRRMFLKLERRMEDLDISRDLLAVKLKITKPTLRTRLKGTVGWHAEEITTICQLLDIRPEEIGAYFFPELCIANDMERRPA